MRKGLTFLSALVIAAGLSLGGVAQAEPQADTVLATVNGEQITLGQVILVRATLPAQYQQIPDDALFDAIMNQLIQQTALKQSLDGAEPPYITLSMQNQHRSLLAEEALERLRDDVATDEAVQNAYDAKYEGGFAGPEYNAAHILVPTLEEAQAIKAELDEGADFAEMAKEKSTGPSGPNGGDLGWFGEGRMVPPFEAAVKELETGQVSAPVETQFGWHVILLKESRRSKAPELDTVRQEIAQELFEAAVDGHLNALVEGADVSRPEVEGFTPDMIKNLDLVRN
ncbi:MAG: peptidylprolyl isomerase [Rhodobacteraceae bacterium]|nr:peptidylprolyl isomerase [Paracoccaceae bacterium]